MLLKFIVQGVECSCRYSKLLLRTTLANLILAIFLLKFCDTNEQNDL